MKLVGAYVRSQFKVVSDGRGTRKQLLKIKSGIYAQELRRWVHFLGVFMVKNYFALCGLGAI